MDDLQDQLKALFPDHKPAKESQQEKNPNEGLWIQEDPVLCKFEKRHGKATIIIDGYTGTKEDFKSLAKEIKRELGVGGSVKNEQIIIQGDVRKEIMKILKEYGFKVKRVGG